MEVDQPTAMKRKTGIGNIIAEESRMRTGPKAQEAKGRGRQSD